MIYVAQQEGYFAKNGVAVRVLQVSPAAIPAGITNGDFQAAISLNTCEQGVIKQNLGCVNLMSDQYGLAGGLFADGKITSISQLNGATVGIGNARSTPSLIIEGYLSAHGVHPNYASLGTDPATRTALEAGRVVAAQLHIDDGTRAQAAINGIHLLVSPAAVNGARFAAAGLMMAKPYFLSHKEVATGLVRALVQAVKFMKAQPTATVKAFEVLHTPPLTKDDATTLYKALLPLLEVEPVPTQAMLTKDGTLGTSSYSLAQIEQSWDLSIAKQVNAELNR